MSAMTRRKVHSPTEIRNTGMDYRVQFAEPRTAMFQAIGECISEWATVEVYLGLIFRAALESTDQIADLIFNAPRSFEARSGIAHEVVRTRLKDRRALLGDWNLVYNHMCYLGGRRNEVAHATLIHNTDRLEVLLEPYFLLSLPGRMQLTLKDVQERAGWFRDVAKCVSWIWLQMQPPSVQTKLSVGPIPDQLLRLRTEDALKREEQRAQQKPSGRKRQTSKKL